MEKNIRNTEIINKDEGIIWRPPLLPPVGCGFFVPGLVGTVTGLVGTVTGLVGTVVGLVGTDVGLVGPSVLFFAVVGSAVDFPAVEGLAVVGSTLEQNVIIPSRQTVMTIDLFNILIAVFVFPMLDEFSSRRLNFLSQIAIELLSHLIGYR